MKNIAELNSGKVPIVIINKKLNKLDEAILFLENVEVPKMIMRKAGLSKK